MKSAYELAMERLEREAPETKITLSETQKQEIAAIDKRYKAKKAERDIFLQQQLIQAQMKQNVEEIQQIERQRRDEMARLDEEMEAAKDAVRNQ